MVHEHGHQVGPAWPGLTVTDAQLVGQLSEMSQVMHANACHSRFDELHNAHREKSTEKLAVVIKPICS